jgi:hypothetical protein
MRRRRTLYGRTDMMQTTSTQQAVDLLVVGQLAVYAARFREQLADAEPAVKRLEAVLYPSAGMLRYDMEQADSAADDMKECLEAMGAGVELCPLEDAV